MARTALGVFLAWSAYGVFRAQLYIMLAAGQPRRPPALTEYIAGLQTAWIWAIFTPAIVWLARRAPLRRDRLGLSILLHCCAIIAFATIDQAVDRLAFIPGIGMRPPMAFRAGVLAQLYQNVFHYLIVAAIAYAARFRAESEDQRVAALRAEAQLARARVQMLQMQLHPHFLFNTLSSITELIHKDPRRAERLVVRLAELLRLTLAEAEVQEVPLWREVELLRAYVGIQTTRFSDRLDVAIAIEPDVHQALVPNMLLQPLVENAVRHGLAPVTGRGRIEVAAWREAERLRIEVRDDGIGLSVAGTSGTGIGLRTTRERLQQLYPDAFEFLVGERAEGGVIATVAIPLRWDVPGPLAKAARSPA